MCGGIDIGYGSGEMVCKSAMVDLAADIIVAIGETFSTHPDPIARIHAGAMLVDAEVAKRMAKLREVEHG